MVKCWQQYLLGKFFVIQIDHWSLKELIYQVIQTLNQQHYLSKLLGYDYEIQYKFDASNMEVDALCCFPKPPGAAYHHLLVSQFVFLEELKKELHTNLVFTDLCDKCLTSPTSLPDFIYRGRLLLHKGKI